MPIFPTNMEDDNKIMDARLEEFQLKMTEEVKEYMKMMDVKMDIGMEEMKTFLQQIIKNQSGGIKIEGGGDFLFSGENSDTKGKMKLEDTYRIKGGLDETYAIKGNYLPRVEIKKFDGTSVRLWLNQLEQYFLLHQVPHDKRVTLAALHMDNKPFQWYQWV